MLRVLCPSRVYVRSQAYSNGAEQRDPPAVAEWTEPEAGAEDHEQVEPNRAEVRLCGGGALRQRPDSQDDSLKTPSVQQDATEMPRVQCDRAVRRRTSRGQVQGPFVGATVRSDAQCEYMCS